MCRCPAGRWTERPVAILARPASVLAEFGLARGRRLPPSHATTRGRTVGGGEKNIQSTPRYSGHGLPLGHAARSGRRFGVGDANKNRPNFPRRRPLSGDSAGRLSRPVPVAPVVRAWVEGRKIFAVHPETPARVLDRGTGGRKKSTLSLASHSSRGWSRAERLRRLYYIY